jgi:hypothetical protein
MDRALIEQHLALAEKHVRDGEVILVRQREVLANLARDGHDTSRASQILQEFEDVQQMHIADRERLRRELAEAL